MSFIDFDPEKHRGRQLFEVQARERDGVIGTIMVPVDTSSEQAAQTPWYYVVEAEEDES